MLPLAKLMTTVMVATMMKSSREDVKLLDRQFHVVDNMSEDGTDFLFAIRKMMESLAIHQILFLNNRMKV